MKTKPTLTLLLVAGLTLSPEARAVEIGFESAQGFASGRPLPAPWINTQGYPAMAQISSTVAKTGSQSLAVSGLDGEWARPGYPIDVAAGESASFSVWVRPGSGTGNYFSMGQINIKDVDANGNWPVVMPLYFAKDIGSNGQGGSTPYNLQFDGPGQGSTYLGDFTPLQWYRVDCAITPTAYRFSVNVDTGVHTFEYPRAAGRVAKEIGFGDSLGSTAYYDDFIYTPPVAAPGVMITSPMEGASFDNGIAIPLVADVDHTGGAVVTGVEFYDNGALIGKAQLSPLGEWSYPDETHLSVMGDGIMGMCDYSPPFASGEQMFMLDGIFPTRNTFQGTFGQWSDALGGMIRGNAGVLFYLQPDGTLNASISGDSPLGKRSLVGGVNVASSRYTLSWLNAPAGLHSLTARVLYGADRTAHSAPVGIMVAPTSEYGSWQSAHFTYMEISEGKADMLGDFDSDGIANLLEYAFNMNPRISDMTGIREEISDGKMRISFICMDGRSDLTYTVQSSSNLETDSWIDIARSVDGATMVPLGSPALSTVSDNGMGTRTVTVTQTAPLAGKGFLRVKVTSP